jgi:hypothetical protein
MGVEGVSLHFRYEIAETIRVAVQVRMIDLEDAD